jgi:NADH-quinone oxidoreductase subunit N
MQDALTVPSLAPAWPEISVALGALALLMLGAFRGDRSAGLINWLSIALLGVGAVLLLATPERAVTFAGGFVVDPFARFMKLLVLVGSAAAILMAMDFMRRERIERFEFPILIVFAAAGMMLMISANDLIAVYLGLELLSLSSYIIAAIDRDSARSTEAGLKYFVLGALSSGMLLYGASLIYGFTGTVSFQGIAGVVQQAGIGIGLLFGLVFLLAGIAFKISAVPFHMWTPDVYEGAPTPVTTFFAGAPKVAAMALFVRVVIDAFPPVTREWQQIVVFISLASMALGSFAAIGQTNFKRLMAYSAIGHAGFVLVGLAAGTPAGVKGVMIYMAIYLAMTLGTFACILALRRGGVAVEDIRELAGLSRTQPAMAALIAAQLFSLGGVPPLAGFFAKLFVFMAAIQVGLYALAAIGFVLSVVSIFYYIRLVGFMYMDAPETGLDPVPGTLRFVLVLTGAFTLFYFLFSKPIENVAETAANALKPVTTVAETAKLTF